nr:hypothetical protein B0A51_08703 [Rachicladosporium sp. CCFEE 5018]
MFATRANQENAVYKQQAATAAKNEGLKASAPKTPGNKVPKTPFKKPSNNENVIFNPGKTNGEGKAQSEAFLTPAGPRTRAPLGNKTTNIKATAFRTPGPAPAQAPTPSLHPTSPRLRRGRVKVLQAEATTTSDDVEEREIEYMPPQPTPLPDHPTDCWPNDRTYPQFEGRNFTRGVWDGLFPTKQDDEESTEMSDLDEQIRALESKQAAERVKKESPVVVRTKTVPVKKDPLRERGAGTMVARKAAGALGARVDGVPGFAAPTAAAKARMPTMLASKKPTAPPGNTRHTVAKVASNTTLGYSKGRVVSAAARKPLGGVHEQVGVKQVTAQMPFGGGTTLDMLLGLGLGDEDEDEAFGGVKLEDVEEDEALQDFQLPTVDL